MQKNYKSATFNLRTLQSIKQMSELISIAVTYHIDVINLQEHRFDHEDIDLKYHELGNGWTFISASALKNTGNSTIGGVGMLLSPHATKSLNSIEKITSRILVTTFHGNPEATLISCYSPTNIADEQEVIDFYDDPSSLIRPKTQCSDHWRRPKMHKLDKAYTINSHIITHLIEMVNT